MILLPVIRSAGGAPAAPEDSKEPSAPSTARVVAVAEAETGTAATPSVIPDEIPMPGASVGPTIRKNSLVAVGAGSLDADERERRERRARVDLNDATAEELSALPGVGPVTARRITAARQAGAFPAVDALLDRKVVSRSVLERIRDQVRV